jgi:hypothetical protein
MLKPKELTPPASLQILPLHGRCVGGAPTLNTLILTFTLSAWCILPTHADTVYRCGDAYSASNQCPHAMATEVKPSSGLHANGQDKSNTATHDLRDTQALEKQRLQAQRQAVQPAPVRIGMPHAPPASLANNEPLPSNSKRQGKHTRQPASPYFTAVDPNAAAKKKSTAKAVPAASASGP